LDCVAKIHPNKNTDMAFIFYVSSNPKLKEILKPISIVGFGSAAFIEQVEVDYNLHGCCNYERPENNNNSQY
jgi:hypothetical protein